MFFRSLTIFRFPNPAYAEVTEAGGMNLTGRLALLHADLPACALQPVGPLELSSRGFVSPFGAGDRQLTHSVGQSTWLTVGTEDRILPSAVVNAELAKRLAAIEQREGRRPGGRARKQLKDELVTELLPRAFVRVGRIDAILDYHHGIVAVDTSSRKAAEGVVSEIRRAIGSFPALPLNAEVSPRSVLTGWIAGEAMPEGLAIGEDCELSDPIDRGAKVRCTRQDLLGDEVRKHLEAGKQVTRLALTLDDRVSFVLGEDLVIRRFRVLDGALDALEGMEREDLKAELDARFTIMAAELRRVFGVLESALTLSQVED